MCGLISGVACQGKSYSRAPTGSKNVIVMRQGVKKGLLRVFNNQVFGYTRLCKVGTLIRDEMNRLYILHYYRLKEHHELWKVRVWKKDKYSVLPQIKRLVQNISAMGSRAFWKENLVVVPKIPNDALKKKVRTTCVIRRPCSDLLPFSQKAHPVLPFHVASNPLDRCRHLPSHWSGHSPNHPSPLLDISPI